MRCVLLLSLLTLGVFGQVCRYQFISLDDTVYVSENPNVLSGLNPESIQYAFHSTKDAGFWQPLTWLSLMVDATCYGDWAGGYHLTNLVLHIANTILLYAWLVSLTSSRWRSFLVAALFGVHPLHVESVAWVTERKDVLSVLFALLSLMSYTRYARTGRRTWYLASAVALGLSLMAKAMLITLPFVFLLLDYWPLRRFTATKWGSLKPVVLEKLPFLLLCALGSGVAVWTQSRGGATRLLTLSLTERLSNAVVSYSTYIWKTFCPAGLSPFYPHPESTLSGGIVAASLIPLLLITLAAVALRRRHPPLIVGWMWFLGTLVPVIGLVQVGMQARADRFTYFPMIGFLIALAWSIPWLESGPATVGRRAVRSVCVVALMVMAVLAGRQTSLWRDDETLFGRAVELDDENWLAHAILGRVNLSRFPNQQEAAEFHLNESIRLRPDHAPAHYNLALLLSERGQLNDANAELLTALQIDPDYTNARYVLCINLYRQGNLEEYSRHRNLVSPPLRDRLPAPSPPPTQ